VKGKITMARFTHAGTSKIIETPQGPLHYHEVGEGEPLILLHGSGPGVTGWANFQCNLDIFAKQFRTLILDMPGYGGSPDVPGNPIENAVAAVIAFMDALGLERVRILGNSLGGVIGCSVAAALPDRIQYLCTIGGIGSSMLSPSPPEGINLLVDFTEDPTRERLISWLHSMVYDPALVTEELIEERYARATNPEYVAASRKIYSRNAVREIFKLRPESSKSLEAFLKIKCPVLITWGRDDRVSPLDMAFTPLRYIENAELHVFSKCGHWAMIERKAEFENVVMAFFCRGLLPEALSHKAHLVTSLKR
jgi:2-hydroxy-6-oxonona-2,4-dienedioate hydrolase